jgi:hypothetical protein
VAELSPEWNRACDLRVMRRGEIEGKLLAGLNQSVGNAMLLGLLTQIGSGEKTQRYTIKVKKAKQVTAP